MIVGGRYTFYDARMTVHASGQGTVAGCLRDMSQCSRGAHYDVGSNAAGAGPEEINPGNEE